MIRFNSHLKKKGISGVIKVDYEQMTLSIEVNFVLFFNRYSFFNLLSCAVLDTLFYFYLSLYGNYIRLMKCFLRFICNCPKMFTYFICFFCLQVQMPQDASNRAVRDTRGLSGFVCCMMINMVPL